ncbi:hypothetical protein K438DRAFT_2029233 [Mycena galopus ATCC 62051]|nr:hypothetical protein K438DRAFT_2029233 [Mycena galopus ATCC 62051]
MKANTFAALSSSRAHNPCARQFTRIRWGFPDLACDIPIPPQLHTVTAPPNPNLLRTLRSQLSSITARRRLSIFTFPPQGFCSSPHHYQLSASMMPKFNAITDAHLIAFLASPSRIDSDRDCLTTYGRLGPHSKYQWSHDHKPDGWLRRGRQMEDLDKKVHKAAAKDAAAIEEKAARSNAKAKKSKKKENVQAKETKTGKVWFTSAGPVPYDPETDIEKISRQKHLRRSTVRDLVGRTGSVLDVERLLSSWDPRGDEDSEEGDVSGEEVEVVRVPLKRRGEWALDADPLTAASKSPASNKKRKRCKQESEVEEASDSSNDSSDELEFSDEEPARAAKRPKSECMAASPTSKRKRAVKREPSSSRRSAKYVESEEEDQLDSDSDVPAKTPKRPITRSRTSKSTRRRVKNERHGSLEL